MSNSRPEIFVSATTSDLASCRQIAKEALLTLGCVPIEQTNFPPDYREVSSMLREKIRKCDAVIHIVGECYGAEPDLTPRRSYTQIEYDFAVELGKPIYSFVCGSRFPFDPHESESEDKRELQRLHREHVLGRESIWEQIDSPEKLLIRIQSLQTRVEALSAELSKSRSKLGWGVAVGLSAIAILGLAIFKLSNRGEARDREAAAQAVIIAQLQSELLEVARHTDAVLARIDTKNLIDIASKNRDPVRAARASVAGSLGLDLGELESKLEVEASELKGVLTEIEGQVAALRSLDRDLLGLKLKALVKLAESEFVAGKHEQSIARFREALELAGSDEYRVERGRIYSRIGDVFVARMPLSQGDQNARFLREALSNFESSLYELHYETEFVDWIHAQLNLAHLKRTEANLQIGDKSMKLAYDAIDAYELVLDRVTRESNPKVWGEATVGKGLGLTIAMRRTPHWESEKRLKYGNEGLELLNAGISAIGQAPPDEDMGGFAFHKASVDYANQQFSSFTESEDAFADLERVAAVTLEELEQSGDVQEWALVTFNISSMRFARASMFDAPGSEKLALANSIAADLDQALRKSSGQGLPLLVSSLKLQGAVARFLKVGQEGLSYAERREIVRSVAAELEEYSEVFSRHKQPRGWVRAVLGHVDMLEELAKYTVGEEKVEVYDRAIARCESVVDYLEDKQDPNLYTKTLDVQAGLLIEKADLLEGEARSSCLGEVITLLELRVNMEAQHIELEDMGTELSSAIDRLIEVYQNPAASEGEEQYLSRLAQAIFWDQQIAEAYRENFPVSWRIHTSRMADTVTTRARLLTGELKESSLRSVLEFRTAIAATYDREERAYDWARSRYQQALAQIELSELLSSELRTEALNEAKKLLSKAFEVQANQTRERVLDDTRIALGKCIEILLTLTNSNEERVMLIAESVTMYSQLVEREWSSVPALSVLQMDYGYARSLAWKVGIVEVEQEEAILNLAIVAYEKAIDHTTWEQFPTASFATNLEHIDLLLKKADFMEKEGRLAYLEKAEKFLSEIMLPAPNEVCPLPLWSEARVHALRVAILSAELLPPAESKEGYQLAFDLSEDLLTRIQNKPEVSGLISIWSRNTSVLALAKLSKFEDDPAALELLADAVERARALLSDVETSGNEVFSAMLRDSLANILHEQALRLKGVEQETKLQESLSLFRSSLSTDFSDQVDAWAEIHLNFGNLLFDLSGTVEEGTSEYMAEAESAALVSEESYRSVGHLFGVSLARELLAKIRSTKASR